MVLSTNAFITESTSTAISTCGGVRVNDNNSFVGEDQYTTIALTFAHLEDQNDTDSVSEGMHAV